MTEPRTHESCNLWCCSSTCTPQQDGLTLTKFCAFRHRTSVPVRRIFDCTNTALIECDSVRVTAIETMLKKVAKNVLERINATTASSQVNNVSQTIVVFYFSSLQISLMSIQVLSAVSLNLHAQSTVSLHLHAQ